jgi:hypothetical protein
MQYIGVPQTLKASELRAEGSLSPSMYRRVEMPTSSKAKLIDLLDAVGPYDKGIEPGSRAYLKRSTHHLLRTRSIRAHNCLLYPQGEGSTPIHPATFVDLSLQPNDILMSKDSNIGEVAMVEGARYASYMPSSGLLRLNVQPAIDRFYLFSFLKHPVFKAQLVAKVPRGATIAHAKSLWKDCEVPFPIGAAAKEVTDAISALMQVIVNKESAIRDRHRTLLAVIEAELAAGQVGGSYQHVEPRVGDLRSTTRLDTGLYSRDFLAYKHRIENYKHGATTIGKLGVTSRRGPNLAVSVIGKSLYSDDAVTGWYQLIRPAAINDYGSLNKLEYLGSPKTLALVEIGDLIFGSEATWRSMVLCEAYQRCTTNFHGTVLSWAAGSMSDIIWLRCMLEFMRNEDVLRHIAVGGQGGHLSPDYFEYVPVPLFPNAVRTTIAALYHSPGQRPLGAPTVATLVDWHCGWDKTLGIWELDRERKLLEAQLAELQDRVIHGEMIQSPVW